MFKILFFLDHGNKFGGAVQTTMQQALIMKAYGHEVIFAISNYYGNELDFKYSEIADSHNVEIVRIPYLISPSPEDIHVMAVLDNYQLIKDLVYRLNPDFLHSVQLNPAVELVARELKIPHIMNIYQAKEDFFSVCKTSVCAKYHICDSELYKNMWSEATGTKSVCIRTYAEENTSSCNKNVYDVLCVGLFCDRKNQLGILHAYKIAVECGYKGNVIFCGDNCNTYGALCKDYVSENGLGGRVKFCGFCTDVNKYYQKAGIVICGSTVESYPNVISEGLASDCIVLSTPVAGVPEVIIDGYNGFLSEDFSEVSLAKKMIQLQFSIESGETIKILRNAKKTYYQHHSLGAVYNGLLSFYSEIEKEYEDDLGGRSEIRIEDFIKDTSEVCVKYREYFSYMLDPVFAGYKLWFFMHLERMYQKGYFAGKKAFLWGTDWTSVVVRELMAIFLPEIQIVGYIDWEKEGSFLGEIIYKPEYVCNMSDSVVFIATEDNQPEIDLFLYEHNKISGVDYFMTAIRMW